MTKKLKPSYKFKKDVVKKLKEGMPVADIQDMAQDYDVSQEEINDAIKNVAVDTQMSLDSKKAQARYLIIDKKFVQIYQNIVIYQQANNTSFYEYKHGVYVHKNDEDMKQLVYSFFEANDLIEQRTSSKKITDTILRIASLLTYENKKRFSDDTLQGRKWYINLKNGLLDPVTKELLPHTPEYFSTTQAPFDYVPDAKCPKFEEFIKTITTDSIGSDRMLQEMFGYIVSTDGNPKHKIFYMYGSVARNGKSTTAKILSGLIGNSNVSSLSLEDIASTSTSIIEPIIGKQMNFSDEVSGNYLQSGRLTSISAEGNTQISPKYKPAFSYKVRTKFVVACNSLPRFTESQGMRHRMIVIPFKYQIPEANRISNYDEVLLNEEGSGILNWALEGAEMLKVNNYMFTTSVDSLEEVEENVLSNNSALAFLNDCYDFSLEYQEKITSKEMYGNLSEGYVEYCRNTGSQPFSMRKFHMHLKTFQEETKKIIYHGKDPRGYSGLRKKPTELDNFQEDMESAKNAFN